MTPSAAHPHRPSSPEPSGTARAGGIARAGRALARTQESLRRAPARLREVPGRLRRTGETERARVEAELRQVLPDLPRRLTRADVDSRIERLWQVAAAAELAREGVELIDRLVDLPDPFTRLDLTAAAIPSLPSYQGFIVAACEAPQVRPLPRSAADVLAAARSASSRDAYGPTLEATGDLVSWLATCAWELDPSGAAGGSADLPSEEPDESAAETLEQSVAAQAVRGRAIIREALVRGASVPQELRAARERHARVTGDDDAQARAHTAGSPDPAGEWPAPGPGGTDPDTTDPAAAGPFADPSPFSDPAPEAEDTEAEDTAAAGAAPEDSESSGSAGSQVPPRPKPSFADRARTVHDFLDSDAGREARDFLRSDAGKAAMGYLREHGRDMGGAARDLYRAAQKRSDRKG